MPVEALLIKTGAGRLLYNTIPWGGGRKVHGPVHIVPGPRDSSSLRWFASLRYREIPFLFRVGAHKVVDSSGGVFLQTVFSFKLSLQVFFFIPPCCFISFILSVRPIQPLRSTYFSSSVIVYLGFLKTSCSTLGIHIGTLAPFGTFRKAWRGWGGGGGLIRRCEMVEPASQTL